MFRVVTGNPTSSWAPCVCCAEKPLNTLNTQVTVRNSGRLSRTHCGTAYAPASGIPLGVLGLTVSTMTAQPLRRDAPPLPPLPPVQRTPCPANTWWSDRIFLIPKLIWYRVSDYRIHARELGKSGTVVVSLARTLVKFVRQDVKYWYPSTIGPLWPTMTDSLLALGREVLYQGLRAPSSTNTWCSDRIFLGSLDNGERVW